MNLAASSSTASRAAHPGLRFEPEHLEAPLASTEYDDFQAPVDERNPLGNFPLLREFNTEKKQTKDGQLPKRRGPKPDSKPALTRRQELNRQAQRTHRERKEMYIKALEEQLMRLKEAYVNTQREKAAVLEENQRLRELLRQHGISYDFSTKSNMLQTLTSPPQPSSSGSISGSYQNTSENTSVSPPPHNLAAVSFSETPPPHQQQQQQQHQYQRMRNMAQIPNRNINYDDVGMDFVLTLERPCMDHMQYLMVRSHNPEGQAFHHPMENVDDSAHHHISGHALMASSVPYSHVMCNPSEPHPQTQEHDRGSLQKLLDISGRLPFHTEGEITPITAWFMIFCHVAVAELTLDDFGRLQRELSSKVHCYGFGAVIEEFDVRDALSAVLAEKALAPGAHLASTAQTFAMQQ